MYFERLMPIYLEVHSFVSLRGRKRGKKQFRVLRDLSSSARHFPLPTVALFSSRVSFRLPLW